MITQFQPQIRGWGAWAQAGYDFTSHWGVWADYGIDQPDYARFNRETGGTLLNRSEEHTSELQSRLHLVCRLLLEKKKNIHNKQPHEDILRQDNTIIVNRLKYIYVVNISCSRDIM